MNSLHCMRSTKMSNPILNIITAVSREVNLYYIQDELNKINSLDIRWYLVFDKTCMISTKIPQDLNYYHAEISNNDRNDSSGSIQKNIALSQIQEGWIYCLDDDNILHPNFPSCFNMAIKKFPDKKAFVFSQTNYANQIIISGKEAKKTISGLPFENWAIDAGGYVVHSDIVKKYNARYKEYVHESDRYFWKCLVDNCPEQIEFFDEIAAYHNALRYEKHIDGCMAQTPYSPETKNMLFHSKNGKRPNYQFYHLPKCN